MRQIYDAHNEGSYEPSTTNGPVEDAAFAFCLGEVPVGLHLKDGTKIKGLMKGFSCLDHRREDGNVEIYSADASTTKYSFREIEMIDLPGGW